MKNDDIAFIVIDKNKNTVGITKENSKFLQYNNDDIIKHSDFKSLDKEIHNFIKGVEW